MDIIALLRRKFDLQAVEQLRAEIVRLDDENERLRMEVTGLTDRVYHAEQNAESWRDDCDRLGDLVNNLTDGQVGIGLTQAGHLVPITLQG